MVNSEVNNETNENNAEKAPVIIIRETEASDFNDVSDIFKMEYGMTYANDAVYDSEKFKEFIGRANVRSIVAVTEDGRIAGHHALKEWTNIPGIYEGGMAVVNPEIRKCGAFSRMIAENNRYFDEDIRHGVMISCAVTVHDITQKTRLKNGFTPCGFMLNVIPPDSTYNYFDNGCARISEALSIHAAGHSPKTVYAPEDARKLIDFVCTREKLPRTLISDKTEITEEKTVLREYSITEPISNAVISSIGKDFDKVLSDIMLKLRENKNEVFTLFISIDSPGAALLYETARAYGMHITGYVPNSGDGDLIIMNLETGNTVEYDKIVTYGPFTDILQMIRELA